MSKVLVVLSGGLDSTVLAHYHKRKMGDEVRLLTVKYGQRHVREVMEADYTAQLLKLPHDVADFTSLGDLLPGSALTDRSVMVPEGHYTAANMKVTVVPNRNMILLSIAAAVAIAHKFDYISYAAHAGDHAIYPDCREEFVQALDHTVQLADDHVVRILRPFVGITKEQIVLLGKELRVPFEHTYSCYTGRPVHCGKCGTCVERREAFHLSGVADPTEYLDRRPISQVLAEAEKQKIAADKAV